ncbi:MAG: large subunit ribosomal protein [Patescibacteria group bacterium]|nr:large subunit ribosomal protein [Patescibacteria group bacterium]
MVKAGTRKKTMSQDNMMKLECTECKTVNYHSHKNKKTLKERLEMKKFCNHCKKHTLHKETK